MRWDQEHRSGEVDPPRGHTGALFGVGTFALVATLSLVFHRGLLAWIAGDGSMNAVPDAALDGAPHEPEAAFVRRVSDDVQSVWAGVTPTLGRPYPLAEVVIFRGATRSRCSPRAQVGPFYCAVEGRVYLDLDTFAALRDRYQGAGDFAQAYVIAHAFGHHLQHALGGDAMAAAQLDRNPSQRALVARSLELQADCFAGVWAAATTRRDLVESSDVDEALASAASTVSDATSPRDGAVVERPETFSHATAVERATWFRRGWASGDPRRCDTLDALSLR